jgi:hypothetical protein
MLSIKVRIYLFYVAAVAFISIGLWLIGAGLFSTGGFTALLVGGLMLATGVVDYAMGRYLQRMYLNPALAQAGGAGGAGSPAAAAQAGPGADAGADRDPPAGAAGGGAR